MRQIFLWRKLICTLFFLSPSLITFCQSYYPIAYNYYGTQYWGCNDQVQSGTTCFYRVNSGSESIYSYSLSGATRISVDGTNHTAVYMKTYSTGTYNLCLRELGGPCIQESQITAYDPVGPVTISHVSPNSWTFCSGEYSATTYTATASNATNYQWTLSPSSAGTISGGTISWTPTFTGDAVLTVTASNQASGSPTTSASQTITRTQSLNFEGYLSISPDNPCEGDPIYFVASANAQATFKWYIDDTYGEPVYEGSTFYTSSLTHNQRVHVQITPLSGIPCLNNNVTITKSSQQVTNFSIKSPVYGLSISNPISERCQDDPQTNYTVIASAISADSYEWTLTPASAGTISDTGPKNSNGYIEWNNAYTGPVTVEVIAHGCRSSIDEASMSINVKKRPTPELTGPAELCPHEASTLSLVGGAEADTNYQLYWKFDEIWKTTGDNTNTSSWNLPLTSISARSSGEYKVVAQKSSCLDAEAFFTIAEIAQSEITVTTDAGEFDENGDLNVCANTTLTFTASGGSDYNWDWDGSQCYPCNTFTKTFFAGVPYPAMKVSGQDNICHEYKPAEKFKIIVTPPLEIKKIEPGLDYRCKGPEETNFTAEVTGNMISSWWDIEGGGGTTVHFDQGGAEAQVIWDENFEGNAIIRFNATGCNSTIHYPQLIVTYPVVESNENLVRSYVAQIPMDLSSELTNNMLDPKKVTVSSNYFDGLGRNVQNVVAKNSPSQKDIVEFKRYDDYGRESIKYLPFTATNTFNYRNTIIEDQLSFYANGPDDVANDYSPVSITQFEPSPINKPLKQGAAGQAWQPVNEDPYNLNDHTTKMVYGFNGSDDVIWFTYNASSETLIASENGQVKYYPPNRLLLTETIDEEQHSTKEYVDKEGRVLCKKVEYDAAGGTKQYASTYYIYDNKGNLVMVLPPEAVNSAIDQLTGN